MAKTVKFNKDIREYKEKTVGPLTGREFLCLGFGTVAMLFVNFVLLADLELMNDIRGFVSIACYIPSIIFGWVKIDGMHIEVFVRYCLPYLMAPKKLTYKNPIKAPEIKPVKQKKSKNKALRGF